MQKSILAMLILSLLMVTSCKKSTSTPPSGTGGGSWVFKGATNNAIECISAVAGSGSTLTASTAANSVSVVFYGSLPTTSGNYTVSAMGFAASASQVGIIITQSALSPSSYFSTGGNGSNESVTVTVSGGKVSVTGSGIMMANSVSGSATATDSAALQFNITQTN